MDDYICREQAMEAAYQGLKRPNEDSKWIDIYKNLKAVPSADVRPVVHGKWINKPTEDGRFTYKACSVCGFPHRAFFEFNYCTNCGADMRGETE